jgi:small redox-active disulfide protein 2
MAKEVRIYGAGCPRCKQTFQVIIDTASQLDIALDIQKVEDLAEIVKAGIMSTPAVSVDGKVVLAGKIPTPAQVKEWIGA